MKSEDLKTDVWGSDGNEWINDVFKGFSWKGIDDALNGLLQVRKSRFLAEEIKSLVWETYELCYMWDDNLSMNCVLIYMCLDLRGPQSLDIIRRIE